jgi:hypothetical protein
MIMMVYPGAAHGMTDTRGQQPCDGLLEFLSTRFEAAFARMRATASS